MALSDLTPKDKKVYEYLKANDFVERAWSTNKAAKALKMKEDDVYVSLCNLAEYMRNNIHIHYREGSIRIGAN
jgi:rRNA processing protein Krr1/Pno1